MAYSIIKNNSKLRKAIIDRLKELDKKQTDVIQDAAKEGYNIYPSALSNYIKHGPVTRCLKEEQIMWVAMRYGIDVFVSVGRPVINEKGGLDLVVDNYDEQRALEKLRRFFPSKAKK